MNHEFTPKSDHDILVGIAGDVALIKTAIYGNGRPGALEAIAAHGEALREISTWRRDADIHHENIVRLSEQLQDIEKRTPSAVERRGVFTTVVATMMIAVATAARVVFHVG